VDVSITGIGLATAQGRASNVASGAPLAAAAPWPRPPGEAGPARVHRPARGIDRALTGAARFAALARAALDDCFEGSAPTAATPLYVATCNGAADAWDADGWSTSFDFARALDGTPWAGQRPAVASAACASGLHALFLARRAIEAGAREAVVLAADIATRPGHDSFETLRILGEADEPAPWQPRRAGFTLGEAAVALRLAPGHADAGALLGGPVLGHDLEGDDGLARVLAALPPAAPSLVLAQGTGPAAADRAELDAIRARLGADVPVTSALHHFGHTLGTSGLLSAALAALASRAAIPRALAMPNARAADGRPLVTGAVAAPRSAVVCRALGGACAALTIGGGASMRPFSLAWQRPAPPPPLRDPLLRKLVYAAPSHRPAAPPSLLLVRLEAPLVPPSDATIGGRLLPSSILEMTPGFVAQLLARSWGFAGPAICLVAPADAEANVQAVVTACRAAGDVVRRVDVRGQGGERDVDWNA
jgi:Beta-ketoacyl synthase, N-terminal domain/Beta-ketoacyl synthase, C-terminal domain